MNLFLIALMIAEYLDSLKPIIIYIYILNNIIGLNVTDHILLTISPVAPKDE